MNARPKAQTTVPWRTLQDNLTDSFTARAKGFLGDEFILSSEDGVDRGHLRVMGLQGAELKAEDLVVLVERTADSRYGMTSGGGKILHAQPGSASKGTLEIRCGESSYTATISLFRNRAVVYDEMGAEVARISGNVTGRSYKVDTEADAPYALPIAVLLIYHTAINRRRAYQTAFSKR